MSKVKILFVEDESDLRKLIVPQLKEFGYDVYEAVDGEEGFRLAKEVHPDVIVSDVVMPKKDGNQLLKELRKSDFGRAIPFIVLTAHVKMKDYFEIVKVDDFIEKPFKGEELIARIEKILSRVKPKSKMIRREGTRDEGESVYQQEPVTDLPEITEILVNKDILERMRLNLESKSADGIRPKEKNTGRSKKEEATSKERILIVENDLRIYSGLQALFEQNGYAVEVVHTPAQCFEAAVRFSPDIIVAKYILYAMKADKLVGILREMSHLHDIPVIVYSDRESGEIEENVLQSGASSFMINMTEEKLFKKVNELLRKRA